MDNKDEKIKKEIEAIVREEIDSIELFFIIKENWKIFLRTIFILVSIGFALSYFKTDTFKAKVVLIVSSRANRINSSNVSLNQKLVSTYTEIAKSASIMRNVIESLSLESSPEDLIERVEVVPVGMTELIEITYIDENPQRTALVANKISEEFIVKIRSIMKFDNLKIIERATVPGHSQSKGTKLIIVITGMIGVILGILEVLWRESYHNRLKNPEDIEKILDCPVLANIPDSSLVELKKNI